MAVINPSTDLKFYNVVNRPADDTGAGGGALDTTSEITGTIKNEVWNTMVYEASTGSDVVWYYAIGIKNLHSSLTYQTPKFWMKNGLVDSTSDGAVSVMSQSSVDDNTKKVRVYGDDTNGNAISDDITLSANSTSTGTKTFKAGTIDKVELLDATTEALVTAGADIKLSRGTDLGIIPAGFDFATREVRFALATDGTNIALNTSETITNRLTAPLNFSPSTWSDANTESNAVSGVDIPAGSYQIIWFKITGRKGRQPTAQNRLVISTSGTSPAS